MVAEKNILQEVAIVIQRSGENGGLGFRMRGFESHLNT